MIELTPQAALAFVLTTGAGTLMFVHGLRHSLLQRREERCPSCGGPVTPGRGCPACRER